MELKQMMLAVVTEAFTAQITVRECEDALRREYIVHVLGKYRWNQVRTANAMGLHRNTLGRMIRELHIDIPALKPQRKKAPAAVAPVEVVTPKRRA